LLPVYRYDGTVLHPTEPVVPQQQHQPTEEQTEGLLARQPPPPPQPDLTAVELELCSICLDEYEAGDRVRVLPCHHGFHARCVGKWLAERSATCPLCKHELWEEEESSSDEEEEEPLVNDETWWNRLYQVLTAVQQEQAVATAENATAPIEAATAAGELTIPMLETEPSDFSERQRQQELFPRPSWWRRIFPGRRSSAAEPAAVETTTMLTEPLLAPTAVTAAEEEAAERPPNVMPVREMHVRDVMTMMETLPEDSEHHGDVPPPPQTPPPASNQNTRQVTV
jgi:hypothetical protein